MAVRLALQCRCARRRYVQLAWQCMQRCGVLGGGTFRLAMRAALCCARRRCVQLGNASSAAVCFAAVRLA
eukprot:gene20998-biopygen17625